MRNSPLSSRYHWCSSQSTALNWLADILILDSSYLLEVETCGSVHILDMILSPQVKIALDYLRIPILFHLHHCLSVLTELYLQLESQTQMVRLDLAEFPQQSWHRECSVRDVWLRNHLGTAGTTLSLHTGGLRVVRNSCNNHRLACLPLWIEEEWRDLL